MNKRLLMRNRRGAARRGVAFSLFVLISMVAIFGFISQVAAPHIAHAASVEENDLKRRQLHTLAECMSKKFINEGNHTIAVWDDLFDIDKSQGDGKTPMNKREIIVVGLDREAENGLMTCDTAIKQGVLALNPPDLADTSENGIRDWFMLHMVGNNLTKTDGKPFKVERSSLIATTVLATQQALVKAEESKIAAPNATLQQQRYFPLAQICYKGYSKLNQNKEMKNNAESFYMPDVGYFYRKSSDEVQTAFLKAGFIKKSGYTPLFKQSVGFGDLNLEFTSDRGATNDFNVGSNDFYPIGTDIKKTSDYKFNAVVDCGFIYKNRDIALAGVTLSTSGTITPPKGITATAASIGAEDNTDGGGGETCGGGSGGGALRWILCPVVSAINDGISKITESFLKPALSTEPLRIKDTDTLYVAWSGFRDFANALLILVFLVIIFLNFFAKESSAFTIKRALPRLVVAAIFIQFSYLACAIIIDIGNVLGASIGSIVSGVAGGAGGSGASTGAKIASTLLVGSAAVGAGAVATVLGAWVLLLPLLLGLLLSILTLLISLGVRIIAINLLVILSPIALLAWTLPNTDKYSTMWLKNMLKLVMMYPFIILILSVAQLVAKIGAGSDGDTWAGMLTLFAPMIAFFMIPATFKMSGTMISGINNAISSRGKAFSKATAGSLNKNMRETIGKQAALTFGDPNSSKFSKTAARFGLGVGTGFGWGDKSRMKRAAATASAFKDKKELLHHDFEEKGISGDNAAMMAEIYDSENKQFKPGVDSFTQAAVMQMIAENGGVEEMSALYETLRARNDGKTLSSQWSHEDRDLWNRATATSRDKLAKALPYAVRPDGDRSLGKMDAEGITGLKSAAGKASEIDASTGLGDSHIELGLADIAARAGATEGDTIEGMSEPIKQSQIDDAKLQKQKILSSMVGVGQSTDRRGRIDAENVKAFDRAVKAGLLDGTSIEIGGVPMTAKDFADQYIDSTTGQLKVVPESGKRPTPPPTGGTTSP